MPWVNICCVASASRLMLPRTALMSSAICLILSRGLWPSNMPPIVLRMPLGLN
ncbi:Uncharacterised protein [Mycobacteroides abscessus subsp. abscessus]|nr:Uncharacterised protein [Mycobacteroides abscessus subsp. abscessus]